MEFRPLRRMLDSFHAGVENLHKKLSSSDRDSSEAGYRRYQTRRSSEFIPFVTPILPQIKLDMEKTCGRRLNQLALAGLNLLRADKPTSTQHKY